MAKKKKKKSTGGVNSGNNTPPPTHEKKHNSKNRFTSPQYHHSIQQDKEQDEGETDISITATTCLSLINNTSSPSSSSTSTNEDDKKEVFHLLEYNRRRIHMHYFDARKLGLRQGDQVLVLQVNNSNKEKVHSPSSLGRSVSTQQQTPNTQLPTDDSTIVWHPYHPTSPKFSAICQVIIVESTLGELHTNNQKFKSGSHKNQQFKTPSPRSSGKSRNNTSSSTPIDNTLLHSSSKKKKKQHPISLGQTYLSPKELHHRLEVCHDEDQNDEAMDQDDTLDDATTTTDTSITTPTHTSETTAKSCATPSSSSKSKFSFARGGGGDVLLQSSLSPSPNMKNKSSSSSKGASSKRDKNKSQPFIQIIPLNRQDLSSISRHPSLLPFDYRKQKIEYREQGQCTSIMNLLAGDASTLALLWIPPSSSSSQLFSSTLSTLSSQDYLGLIQPYLNATKVLERIIHVSCQNQYVSIRDIITISFQGKKVQFYVVDAFATNAFIEDDDMNINKQGHIVADKKKQEQMQDTVNLSSMMNSFADLNVTANDEGVSSSLSHTDNANIQSSSKGEHDNIQSNSIVPGTVELSSIHSQIKGRRRRSSMDNTSAIESKTLSKALYRITFDTKVHFSFENNQCTPSNDNKQNKASRITRDNDKNSQQQAPSTSGIKDHHQTIITGVDSIIESIHSTSDLSLLHPEMFPKTGPIRAPKGMLIHGASGCGKSLLASQIVRNYKYGRRRNACDKVDNIETVVEDETGLIGTTNREKMGTRVVDTIYIQCADIQASMHVVGEGERRLTRIFESAELKAKNDKISTLIVLDDIHLICPRRGSASNGSSSGDRVASTLLALMDGIGKYESKDHDSGNIFVLAITSNPGSLDAALRRAGRLDEEVEIPIPDDSTRAQIFGFLLDQLLQGGNVLIKDDANNSKGLSSLATLAKGFTGADCTLSVKEATRTAVLRCNNTYPIELCIEDLRNAIKITKPSSIKTVTVEVPHVPWTAIGGMDDVKRSLREAVELPLTHPHLFRQLNVPPPRGVLLYGPPGCSKTLMARALATEAKYNFLAVKGPELLSKWLGESERALASLFRRARMASPSLIFFDEVDAIATKRGATGGNSGGDRMLSQLLTELDGISTPTGSNGPSTGKYGQIKSQPMVVVVAATNRPDLLDKALTRPGRIDRMIYVGIPDKESREAIFSIELDKKACDPDIDIHKIASEEISGGFSGAEIVGICREAAFLAIEESDESPETYEPTIGMSHILKSINGTKRQITPKMLLFYDSFQARQK